MNFEYKLTGAGWALATLEMGTQKIEMTVSYLHDSLANLTEVLLILMQAPSSGSVVFMEEPGEHEMILTRTNDQLEIEIKWFDDWASWDMYPKDQFKSVLKTKENFWEAYTIFKKAIESVLNEHGLDGYKDKWGEHDFPEMELLELKKRANT